MAATYDSPPSGTLGGSTGQQAHPREVPRRSRLLSGLLILSFLGPGCCGGDKSWRRGAAGGPAGADPDTVVEFRPQRSAASRYNDPADRKGGCGDLIGPVSSAVDAAARDAGKAPPVVDGRLCAMAEELARLAGTHGPPPYAAVAFALQHRGVIEPSPHLIVVQSGPGDAEGVARELAPRLADLMPRSRFARLGAGSAARDGKEIYVVALQESHVETDPIPRRAAAGDTIVVKGRLLPPFQDPAVLVTGEDGKVSRRAVVKASDREFWARIRCEDQPSTQQVEIIGHDEGGATVVANFPVYCDREPPASISLVDPRIDDGTGGDPAAVEQRLFALLNEARTQAGLPALAWSDDAARVARRHGEDMRDSGFVGHISPTTGSAQDRMQAAGVATPVVLENVARAYSAVEAHVGLMESPGHRANILTEDATHVGIGVVAGQEQGSRNELYVTQLFFLIPRKVNVADAREAAFGALARQRRDAGAGDLRRDPTLDEIAQRLAGRLARGEDEAAAQREADAATAKLASRYGAVVTVRVILGDPSRMTAEAVIGPNVVAAGVGVAQGDHPQVGKNAIWVVALLGRSR